jgi:hypothetical protein
MAETTVLHSLRIRYCIDGGPQLGQTTTKAEGEQGDAQTLPALASALALGGGGILGLLLALLHRGRLDVLPPHQEGGVSQVHEILARHVAIELRPIAGEHELLVRREVDMERLALDSLHDNVAALDQHVVAGLVAVLAGGRDLGRWVDEDGFRPDLVGATREERVGGVLDEVDVAMAVIVHAGPLLLHRRVLVVVTVVLGRAFFGLLVFFFVVDHLNDLRQESEGGGEGCSGGGGVVGLYVHAC